MAAIDSDPPSRRRLHFGAFMNVPCCHPTGWRAKEAVPEADIEFQYLAEMAQTAERGKLDCLFFQDSAAIPGTAKLYGGKSPFNPLLGRQVYIEPVTAIAALAALTSHVGLVSTCTTTYNEPYHVARRFLTIDHISGGRAGWNLVTSQAEDEAVNFGAEHHMDHALRYERASEFHDVVIGLWDSWEDDAFLRDKESGVWFDRDKMHFLNHDGTHFKVRGPMNVSRSPQGRPVVAQAGSSDAGMELAARTAELIFTAQTSIESGRAFRAEMHRRAARYGRAPHHLCILPGLMPIVGRTEAEAREKYEELQSLVDDEGGLRGVARLAGGLDLSQYSPDGPLPDLPPSNAARARQQMIIELGKKGLTIRQIGRVLAMSQAHRVAYGTAEQLADDMQAWLEAGACDGFNLLFAHYPKPLEDFVDLVVPELQRRGIFRTEYEGSTLRANLGIPEPPNSFVERARQTAGAG